MNRDDPCAWTLEDVLETIRNGLFRVAPIRVREVEGERYRLWVISDGVTPEQAAAMKALLNDEEYGRQLTELVIDSSVRICPHASADEHRGSYFYDKRTKFFCCAMCQAIRQSAADAYERASGLTGERKSSKV